MWTNVLNAHRIHNIYVNTRTLTNENCTFTDGSLRFFRSFSLPFSPLHIHGLHVSKAKIYAPCLFCCFHSLFFLFYCYLFLGSYNFCIFFSSFFVVAFDSLANSFLLDACLLLLWQQQRNKKSGSSQCMKISFIQFSFCV